MAMVHIVTRLLFLMCIVAGLALARGDGQKGVVVQSVNPDTSTPDAWGYTWVRSNEPGGPTFRWIDISTRGTLVTGLGDDNFVGPIPMQFAFPYYWYTVSSFYIGSNGYVNFSSPANFASPFAALPNTTTPNDLLAICAGDLDFTVTAANPRCYYWSNGNDSLVVSFINVTEWQTAANPNLKHTFQVILNRADSSITYQYGRQEGRYNATNNTTLCIGWENQTGQIGLSYTYSTAPPHALLPDSGTAIKIKRTENTGLSITDVGIVGGLNAGNLGKVVITNQPDTLKAVVKNFGTANVSNVQVRYQATLGLQPAQRDTVIVPTLNAGQTVTVVFPRLFVPAVTGSYSVLFNATVPGDIGPGNNSKTAEIVSQTFVANQPSLVKFENGAIGGSVNWTGGGGMGVAFDLPSYPVKVESVYVSIATVTAQPLTIEVLDGSTGVPGTVLASKAITAVANSLNAVSFSIDNIRITGGRFFVGARGQMGFNYESTAPISYRTWEFTNGWAPYRSGDLQDVIIRTVVIPQGGTSVHEIGAALPTEFSILQNYPNPFNPGTTIRFAVPEQARVSIEVFNVLGQQIATLDDNVHNAGTFDVVWNGKNDRGEVVTSGIYLYRMLAVPVSGAGSFVSTKKMLVVK